MNTPGSVRIDHSQPLAANVLQGLSEQTRAAVAAASIVLVPDDGFRDYAGPVFPQGSIEFFEYLKVHAPPGASVEIAAEDATYREVAVHFDVVRLATLLVEYVGVPILTGVIAAYLKDWLGSRFSNAEVRSTMMVKRKNGDAEQLWQVSYEGPASTFEATIKEAMRKLDKPSASAPLLESPTAPTQKPKKKPRR